MSKRIQIVTTCRATVRERWELVVPDGSPIGDGIPVEEVWSDLLDHPEQWNAELVSATDADVFDEDDREFESAELEDKP